MISFVFLSCFPLTFHHHSSGSYKTDPTTLFTVYFDVQNLKKPLENPFKSLEEKEGYQCSPQILAQQVIACVASVSSRGSSRKLGQEQKK